MSREFSRKTCSSCESPLLRLEWGLTPNTYWLLVCDNPFCQRYHNPQGKENPKRVVFVAVTRRERAKSVSIHLAKNGHPVCGWGKGQALKWQTDYDIPTCLKCLAMVPEPLSKDTKKDTGSQGSALGVH
jgi:hypothetical protein